MFNKVRKHILLAAAFGMLATTAQSQALTPNAEPTKIAFSHLDGSLSLGMTGIGLEVSAPITSWLKIRSGFSWMPQFNIPMSFELETFDENGKLTGKIQRLQELIKENMGINMDDCIDMDAKSTMVDFTMMFDFYPLPKNTHWSLTAGFYWGNSKVGHIQNNIIESPTLVGMIFYNKMYDYFNEYQFVEKPIYGNVYFDFEQGMLIRDKFVEYGRLGAKLGNYKDTGEAFIMVPNEDGMVVANMYVNHFKPYLGVNYETNLDSKSRWHFATRLGALFWGGTPKILTHSNQDMQNNPPVNMSKDLDDIPGKVGDYVSIVRSLKVYPVLNVSISYTIF